MSSWPIRVSVLAVMLASFAGCDSNPGGPSVPTDGSAVPGESSKPGAKVPLPANKARTVEGPKPLPPD